MKFRQSKTEKDIAVFKNPNKEIFIRHYDHDKRKLELKAGFRTVNLRFDLKIRNEKVMLRFFGNPIVVDVPSMTRIIEALWDEELPNFPESNRLREELGMQPDETICFGDCNERLLGKPAHIILEIEAANGLNK